MKDKFDWIKLHKDHPKAYKHMEDNFECLYTDRFKMDVEYDGVRIDDHPFDNTIKHPLKRDLYDFFDGVSIMVTIMTEGNKCYVGYVDNISNIEDYTTRSGAETEAFTKAFEILEERLNE